MTPEFDDADDDITPLRVVRNRPAPKADASPAQQLLEILQQIRPLLSALLSRSPVVRVAAPVINVPSATVQVTVPPRPCRTVQCHIERDREGRATTITFTES